MSKIDEIEKLATRAAAQEKPPVSRVQVLVNAPTLIAMCEALKAAKSAFREREDPMAALAAQEHFLSLISNLDKSND